MSDVPSFGKYAADVSAELIKSSFLSVAGGISSALKKEWLKYSEDYAEYMARVYKRNSNVKIICSNDESVKLYDVYVDSKFASAGRSYESEEVIALVRSNKRIIITGNGGQGKTFFLRHLWLVLFENPFGKIPVFVELRNINDVKDGNIKTLIRLSMSIKGQLNSDVFHSLCKAGSFIFILDGLDEVARAKHQQVVQDIIEMSEEFPNSGFVVTSRPDNTFSGWGSFQQFHALPFEYTMTKELLKKVPFNEERRSLFLKKLTEKFFRDYIQFLSNPLLSIIMMMTFRENIEIPDKLNNFYDAAFNTLFVSHDATKLYKRDRALDKASFQKIFGVFSLLSYIDESYEFSSSDLDDYIEKAKKITGVKVDTSEILLDFTQAVNILMQDGINYVFIHRSFQEYFAAYALTRVVHKRFDRFIPKIKDRTGDKVVKMAFQFDELTVVEKYIRPEFSQKLSKFTKSFNIEKPYRPLMEVGFCLEIVFWVEGKRVRLHPQMQLKSVSFILMVLSSFGGNGSDYDDLIMPFRKFLLEGHKIFTAEEIMINRGQIRNRLEYGDVLNVVFTDSSFSLETVDGCELTEYQIGKVYDIVQKNRGKFEAILRDISVHVCREGAKAKSICERMLKDYEDIEEQTDDILESMIE